MKITVHIIVVDWPVGANAGFIMLWLETFLAKVVMVCILGPFIGQRCVGYVLRSAAAMLLL